MNMLITLDLKSVPRRRSLIASSIFVVISTCHISASVFAVDGWRQVVNNLSMKQFSPKISNIGILDI